MAEPRAYSSAAEASAPLVSASHAARWTASPGVGVEADHLADPGPIGVVAVKEHCPPALIMGPAACLAVEGALAEGPDARVERLRRFEAWLMSLKL